MKAAEAQIAAIKTATHLLIERTELVRHFQTVRDSADAALAGLAAPTLRSVA